MKKIKLFCIPYAGGSAYTYMNFKEYLPNFEIIPVELKGRGMRFKEKCYETFNEAVDDIYYEIKDKITDSNYAILGHSMGSWLAYELYYKIIENNKVPPMHIFFSGREAPSVLQYDSEFYDKSDEILIEALKKLGGMDERVLENKEVLNTFLLIIRSDLKVLNDFKFKEKKNKIHSNVTVLSGIEDRSISYRNLYKWIELVDGQFSIAKIDGGHFYLNDNKAEFCKVINKIESGE